jgi:hypothetical protein
MSRVDCLEQYFKKGSALDLVKPPEAEAQCHLLCRDVSSLRPIPLDVILNAARGESAKPRG